MRGPGTFAALVLLAASALCAEPSGQIAALMQAREDMEEARFGKVIEATTGHKVVPVNLQHDSPWLNRLAGEVEAMVDDLNRPGHPVHDAGRINEASRPVEEALVERLAAVPGWRCTFAGPEDGSSQRSGYPDIRLDLPDGKTVYLDPKLYAADSRESSFRAFYYSPQRETNKILADACHIIVGIAHEPDPQGRPRFVHWSLNDAADMPIRLKIEFQASNADIYRDAATLASGKSGGD